MGGEMGLSATAMDGRTDKHANGNRNANRRKPLILLISGAVASLLIGTAIAAGTAVLNYKPAQQHVQFEITPPNK